jgi:hypothetical protein
MEIQFRTKEEANLQQEKEFLALSPTERIYRFLDLMQRINRFPSKAKPVEKNFVINITTVK